MIVISPWSKGGYVSSEFFDHTSLIRFIEQRFGPNNPALFEHNITPWRRAVSGDLTSAFNFKSPNDATVPLPSTVAYIPPDTDRHPDYVPTPPTDQALPLQETGTRPARPVPYELHVHGTANFSDGTFEIHFGNAGKTAVYQVRSGNSALGPWSYTVGSGAAVSDTWQITANSLSTYDLSVNGPNGFLRAFRAVFRARTGPTCMFTPATIRRATESRCSWPIAGPLLSMFGSPTFIQGRCTRFI